MYHRVWYDSTECPCIFLLAACDLKLFVHPSTTFIEDHLRPRQLFEAVEAVLGFRSGAPKSWHNPIIPKNKRKQLRFYQYVFPPLNTLLSLGTSRAVQSLCCHGQSTTQDTTTVRVPHPAVGMRSFKIWTCRTRIVGLYWMLLEIQYTSHLFRSFPRTTAND